MSPVLKFIQITDSHICRDREGVLSDCNTYVSLCAVIDQIKKHEWPVAGILATGDLSHDGTESSYQLLHEVLAPLKTPVYCLPGNHDNVDTMRNTLDGDCIVSAERILRDDWQFIMVASSVAGETGGAVSDLQMFAIEKYLQQFPNMPTLIAIHHPPIVLDSPWLDAMSLRDGDIFLDTLARYPQVKAVIFGHAHQEIQTQYQHMQIFGCPSTCTQFRPHSQTFALDDISAGYRVLNLHQDGQIETHVKRIPD